MKRNSKPVFLFAPKHVLIPLRKQVQTELDQMEALGVISAISILHSHQICANTVLSSKL